MRTLFYTLLLILAFATSCIKNPPEPEAKEYIREGMTVPGFTTAKGSGSTFSSPEEFTGKTTLLLFFATWCPSCQRELPEINKVWEALKEDEAYNVVAVSRGGVGGQYAQNIEIVQAYWDANQLTIPWYLDPNRAIFELFATSGIPRAYIINTAGTVVWRDTSMELNADACLRLLKKHGIGV